MTALVAWLSLAVALTALALAVRSARLRPAAGPAVSDAVPGDLLGLRQEVAALRLETTGALRHLAVVRYDAFGDVGGQQSWSVALLDNAGDGLVLTAIHGRSEARSYAKSVAGWHSAQPLSPEEEQAIARARPAGS